ncbi:MAG: flagellar export chaperone FlgN [Planctomycetales bacterium]|nr:flagellar export chaperone FlgN [Planctomycetales bacterium]
MTTTPWESDIASLLQRLAGAQTGLLALLAEKRQLIVQRDHQSLAALAPREQELAAELHACHEQRTALLARAGDEGLPAQTLTDLNGSLPHPARGRLDEPLAEARERSRLVRHECLAQWVAVQRSVLHLSQLLEIFATGGRSRPTYGNGEMSAQSGSLMDQAV